MSEASAPGDSRVPHAEERRILASRRKTGAGGRRARGEPLVRLLYLNDGVRFVSCLGLLTLLAVSPFFGGAQSQLAWSVMGMAVLLFAAVVLATTLRRARRIHAPRVLVALSLLALLLLLQFVPLPASVVGALSPRRADLAARTEAALGREPPRTSSLTLSTKTTRDALCLLAVYAFGELSRAGQRRCPHVPARANSPRRLPRALCAALAAVALVFAGLLMPIARAGYWKLRAEVLEEAGPRAKAFSRVLSHDWRDSEARLTARPDPDAICVARTPRSG